MCSALAGELSSEGQPIRRKHPNRSTLLYIGEAPLTSPLRYTLYPIYDVSSIVMALHSTAVSRCRFRETFEALNFSARIYNGFRDYHI